MDAGARRQDGRARKKSIMTRGWTGVALMSLRFAVHHDDI